MNLLLLAPILFGAFVVQTTAGFGSVMITLAVGTLLWPVSELLPIVVSISLALSAYILWKDWRSVRRDIVGKLVFPCMGIGIAFGFFLSPHVSANGLRILLGVVVLLAASRGLYRSLAPPADAPTQAGNTPGLFVWVVGAGVVHGLLATGGPPPRVCSGGSRPRQTKFSQHLSGGLAVF